MEEDSVDELKDASGSRRWRSIASLQATSERTRVYWILLEILRDTMLQDTAEPLAAARVCGGVCEGAEGRVGLAPLAKRDHAAGNRAQSTSQGEL